MARISDPGIKSPLARNVASVATLALARTIFMEIRLEQARNIGSGITIPLASTSRGILALFSVAHVVNDSYLVTLPHRSIQATMIWATKVH